MPRVLLSLVTVFVLLFVAACGGEESYEFNGGYYDPPREAHEFVNAVDQNGDPFTLADHADKTVFLYFGYTHCPDACPATLA